MLFYITYFALLGKQNPQAARTNCQSLRTTVPSNGSLPSKAGRSGQANPLEVLPYMLLRSSVAPGSWPAILTGNAATLIALQQQLDASQWWSAAQLRAHQFHQLQHLVAAAIRTVPFYAQRLAAVGLQAGRPISEEFWARIPILTRKDVRQAGMALHATETPPSHGGIAEVTTGGSTGVPVRVRKTYLTQHMWEASHIREKLWQNEDMGGTVVRLLSLPAGTDPALRDTMQTPAGAVFPNWGGIDDALWQTGKHAAMSDTMPIADQAAFACLHQANHILTMPANLRLLVAYFRKTNTSLPSLRSIWTQSEIVDDTLRQDCRDIFNCEIVDNYSAAETGFIALQCPGRTTYHIQSETMFVEILDANGRPCAPGEIGRVIVTPLHNYATPLLRDEVADEAECGEPCPCGRGLPVLNRIVGRSTDYLTIALGDYRRPNLGYYQIAKIRAIEEFQYVQRGLTTIELMLVTARPLNAEEILEIREMVAFNMGPEFELHITYHRTLPRTKAGKLRPFISDLSQVQ